jgi:hypothetical protein
MQGKEKIRVDTSGLPRRIWARQGPILYLKFFLTGRFLWDSIEIQNLSKAQALGALVGVAAMHLKNFFISPLFLLYTFFYFFRPPLFSIAVI